MRKNAKLLSILALLLLVTFIPCSIHAQAPVRIFVKGNAVTSDVEPIIENNRTLVPIRVISESLGYDVKWINSERKVIISKADLGSVTLHIGQSAYQINNEQKQSDVAPFIKGDRTFVPLRLVAESFDMAVTWSDKDRTVSITEKPVPPIQKETPKPPIQKETPKPAVSNNKPVTTPRKDLFPEVRLEHLVSSGGGNYVDRYGFCWCKLRYTNNSSYPVTLFWLTLADATTGKVSYLTNYDTVMPGEKSPEMKTIIVENVDQNFTLDPVLLNLEYKYRNNSGEDVHVVYDFKLHEYKVLPW